MVILETIAVAFSMYSAIPTPQFEWTEKNMKYALCAFPLIGVVIGFVCWAIAALCGVVGIPAIFQAALLCAAPVLITGGIHLDGFADTSDALASHADRQKKLEILSDPHVGSFAVIKICVYFIIMFAAWASLRTFMPVPFICSFCMSRVLSALAVSAFPMAKKTGLAYTFAVSSERKRVCGILIVADILLFAAMAIASLVGLFMALAAHLMFAVYYAISRRIFGGITGDLAGWFLTLAEMWMLIIAVITEILI